MGKQQPGVPLLPIAPSGSAQGREAQAVGLRVSRMGHAVNRTRLVNSSSWDKFSLLGLQPRCSRTQCQGIVEDRTGERS